MYQECVMFHAFEQVTDRLHICKRCGEEKVTLPRGSVCNMQTALAWVIRRAGQSNDLMLELSARRLSEVLGDVFGKSQNNKEVSNELERI